MSVPNANIPKCDIQNLRKLYVASQYKKKILNVSEKVLEKVPIIWSHLLNTPLFSARGEDIFTFFCTLSDGKYALETSVELNPKLCVANTVILLLKRVGVVSVHSTRLYLLILCSPLAIWPPKVAFFPRASLPRAIRYWRWHRSRSSRRQAFSLCSSWTFCVVIGVSFCGIDSAKVTHDPISSTSP